MQEFVANYGYPALFLGSILEGESTLIAAGFLSRGGHLYLPLVMLIAFAGTYLADMSIYFLGRARGEAVMARFPVALAYYPKVKSLFARYGVRAIFVTRYLYGFRLAAAATLGLIKMKRITYLSFNFLSCLIWAALVGSLGYIFGASLEALIGQVKHYEKLAVLFIVIVGIGGWLVRRAWSKRKQRNRTEISPAESSNGGDGET